MWRHSISCFAAAASLWGVAALTGCGGQPGGSGTPDGTLTVAVKPTATAVAGLQLASGRSQIEGLTVLGDVAPNGRTMVSEFNLDLLSTGASFTLSTVPQGIYSRVHFAVDETQVAGSWRGMPLSLALESDNGVAVDLRSNGVELAPGHDGELTVGVDVGAWFAGNVLDGATPDQGQLVVDKSHNATVAAEIQSRLPASFSLQDTSAPVH